jgi:hypothetical protein
MLFHPLWVKMAFAPILWVKMQMSPTKMDEHSEGVFAEAYWSKTFLVTILAGAAWTDISVARCLTYPSVGTPWRRALRSLEDRKFWLLEMDSPRIQASPQMWTIFSTSGSTIINRWATARGSLWGPKWLSWVLRPKERTQDPVSVYRESCVIVYKSWPNMTSHPPSVREWLNLKFWDCNDSPILV